jgi:hypothetical protein
VPKENDPNDGDLVNEKAPPCTILSIREHNPHQRAIQRADVFLRRLRAFVGRYDGAEDKELARSRRRRIAIFCVVDGPFSIPVVDK